MSFNRTIEDVRKKNEKQKKHPSSLYFFKQLGAVDIECYFFASQPP
jgi:hypothetical protein